MAVAVLPTWNGESSKATNRGRAVLWQLNVNIVSLFSGKLSPQSQL